ncbi:lipid A biosynthesis acyltransferase [Chitinimonas arctica]|uniref:Lipid A biosynthesis acyltransferase n=2 Tax=Chitinimonas arctica TaxID=2594795 RepID=A0A516SMD0_9NEIS|nr:lipid A biosynthesis acyltransferase [Chitinimonas arctica]
MPGLLNGLLWLLHWIPFRLMSRLGGILGELLYRFAGERRQVGEINLKLCFPAMPDAERAALLRRHFRMMARAFLEYAYSWHANADELRRLVRVEGMEHLEALRDRPVILFAGHFTGLEICGLRLSVDVPMIDIFTHQKHDGLDELMRAKRGRFGGRLVARQEGIRPILRALKEGWRLYYLPDQDLGERESVFLPFFGVQAATITALSRLAQSTGAAVVPCFPYREENGYVMRIEAPLPDFPSDDPVADAARMNLELEGRILHAPEQYFWLHKRFKTRPPGEARFYD